MAKVEVKKINKYLLVVLMVVGLVWLRSSLGKFAAGDFVDNLPKTLGLFASKNPYPLFKEFLLNTAIPNSFVFGNLVQFGELFSAVAITGVSVYLLLGMKRAKLLDLLLAKGLIVGALLSLTFWLAAGWMSPSTDGLNLLMLAIELVGLFWVWSWRK